MRISSQLTAFENEPKRHASSAVQESAAGNTRIIAGGLAVGPELHLASCSPEDSGRNRIAKPSPLHCTWVGTGSNSWLGASQWKWRAALNRFLAGGAGFMPASAFDPPCFYQASRSREILACDRRFIEAAKAGGDSGVFRRELGTAWMWE